MLLSASNDRNRPHLHAVYFEADAKGIRVVATDGHQIAIYRLNEATGLGKSLVSRDDVEGIVAECRRAGKRPVTLNLTESRLETSRKLSFTPVEATFPDYRTVLPEKAEKPFVGHVDTAKLINVARAFTMMSTSKRSHTMRARQPSLGLLDPIVFTSMYCADMMIILMPVRADDSEVSLDQWRPE